MKVLGVEIPQECIDTAIARMRSGPFKAHDIENTVAGWFGDRDVGLGIYKRREMFMRASDRIIQQHRKAGRIARARKTWWRWVPEGSGDAE